MEISRAVTVGQGGLEGSACCAVRPALLQVMAMSTTLGCFVYLFLSALKVITEPVPSALREGKSLEETRTWHPSAASEEAPGAHAAWRGR